MKFQMESDFSKHVKSTELLRVYLLYGSQVYLIGLYEKMLIKKTLGTQYNSFNLHRFHNGNLDMQSFYNAVEQLPMFAENCCVTLDLDVDKLDASSFSDLCKVLADPPNTTTVIVTVKKQPSKRDRLRTLIKTCHQAGGVVELGARTSSNLLRFLRDRAQKNGCELSSENASYLIQRCTDDMQLLWSEMEKLCAYVGSGTITREHIDAVVTTVLQARVFDLSKAILRGNFTQAMELVDQLSDLREPSSKVLAVLAGSFVDLYRGYSARQAGITSAQAAIDLGYAKNREFVMKNAMRNSGAFSAGQIGKMLSLLADADSQTKSTGVDDRVVLEQTIANLFLLTEKK